MPTGSLDNLLITRSGDIALIECKLWRNPEARRHVIGQIIDYATELAKWNYERLEEAISRARVSLKWEGEHKVSLFQRVMGGTPSEEAHEADEPKFIDAVSRNLRRGRFLLLIVGDGIREGVEGMTEFLQQHAGLHFTLGLVEMGLFRLPAGGFIVQPRVMARTTNIDRGIVTIDDSGISIKPSAGNSAAQTLPGQRTSITKEHFLEVLDAANPGTSTRLSIFNDKLLEYGVSLEFGTKSMVLRWYPDDPKSWNLGMLIAKGEVWFDHLGHRLVDGGHIELFKEYLQALAKIIPGAIVKETPQIAGWYVSLNGKAVKISALLEDDARMNSWLQAIGALQTALKRNSPND